MRFEKQSQSPLQTLGSTSADRKLDRRCVLQSHTEATEVETHNGTIDYIIKSSHAACSVRAMSVASIASVASDTSDASDASDANDAS